MFLVSSDRELEQYQKKLDRENGTRVPTTTPPYETRKRTGSASSQATANTEDDRALQQRLETVRSKQRDVLVTTHSWIGAAIGALDGSFEHSAMGTALGSRAFRKDQTFSIGDALTQLIKKRKAEVLNTNEDDSSLESMDSAQKVLEAVIAEAARLRRNQTHWEIVANALRNSSRQDTEESQAFARRVSFSRLMGNKSADESDAAEAAVERKAVMLDAAAIGRGTGKKSSSLVARLVPRHLIAGASNTMRATKESKLNTEIRLYAGTVTSLGRDVTNDVQIRDAAASRRHGRIEVSSSGSQIYFVDLGSSNGTEIDGIQISAHEK